MLDAYRVLDLADDGALLCGQILGDLGADVIAVEPPTGRRARAAGPFRQGERYADRSLNWWALNRNKRGMTLDLETEAGRERLRDLARGADVLIESHAPGYLGGRGLGYRELSAVNPRLVMVSITPFGQEGPKSSWAASDLTVWAASGAQIICGDADRPPVSLAVPQSFMHAGAEAAVGALIALTARERDGAGQHIDISAQTAAMMSTQATVLAQGWNDVAATRLAGGVNFGGLPLKFVHPAKDGYVSVTFLFGSAIGPFTRRLMEVMCDEGVVDEATRDKDWINYTALLLGGKEPPSELIRCNAAVGAFTQRHTKEELFRMSLERGLLIVPVATTEEVVRSEQLAGRAFWATVEHPELGESYTYPGAFAKMSATPITTRRRPPLLGEHNDEVAGEAARALPAGSASATSDRRPPLEGLKLLEFTWVMAGPWGTRYFSDYGATVVKVESTTKVDTLRTIGPFKDHTPGAERSAAYATVNAGKLGMTLNLAHPKGRDVATRLAAWADVVTESFAPGAMAKFGLDYDSLRKVNPLVIMLSSCLNGQTGPHRDLAGFGTMGQQLAGFGALAGWPDRAPAGAPGAYTDYVAPKFMAAAILAALEHRRRTGDGQYIDFSQGESSMGFLAPAILDYTVNGHVMERRGNASPDYAPHGVFPAAGDDRWVAIVATTDAEWQGLASVAGDALADDRFRTNASRLEHNEALEAALSAWTREREVDEIERALQAKGVPVHRLTTMADAFSDPQLAAREHFVTVEHGELGPVPVENSRMRFSATPARVTAAGPTFGQHTEQVLTEILGIGEEEMVDLLADGVLQ